MSRYPPSICEECGKKYVRPRRIYIDLALSSDKDKYHSSTNAVTEPRDFGYPPLTINQEISSMNFDVFRDAVAAQFASMQKGMVFHTLTPPDGLYSLYLESFPAGTDPIYRKRSLHDCGCCKGFIRAVGGLLAIGPDGAPRSIWDISIQNEPAYQAVAAALSRFVKLHPISEPFLYWTGSVGTASNYETPDKQWSHFAAHIAPAFLAKKDLIPSQIATLRASHDVFLRGLSELSPKSVDTVLELIAQRSLYRGEEHKFALQEFKKAQQDFRALKTYQKREIFAWSPRVPGSVAHIRNSVIGTLLVDLSAGADLEGAVGSYEAKVAPSNYKRPSALITASMIKAAQLRLTELGLASALERRFATINDISINNVLFADRAAARHMAPGDVFHTLKATLPTKIKNLDKVQEVPIERFLSEVLPLTESVEILLENSHAGNLVSLVAPQDPSAGSLFKWQNNFSWSYAGELTDSVKERVKRAGGSVTGDLCCRLSWFNRDDLDLHMIEPSGFEICFRSKGPSPSGGLLDVDMNVSGETRTPVENIAYKSHRKMKEGTYTLRVHNFTHRESEDVGFEVELDFLGTLYKFSHPKVVRPRTEVSVVTFKISHSKGIEIISSLPSTESTRVLWSLPTQSFHRVNAVLLSPNHWDGAAVGNKHYFFILDGCKNDGTVRGFFNEFLKEELNPHRKVFEILAARTKPPASTEQLSGVGFSSTQPASILCRVKGSFSRQIKIII